QGNLTQQFVPVPVSGFSSGVEDVAAGYWHTCAIRSGALCCWGKNMAGQLGQGTTTDAIVPTLVPGFESGVTAVSAGGWLSTVQDEQGQVVHYFEGNTCAIK